MNLPVTIWLFLAVLVGLCGWMSVIDWRTYRLPNPLTGALAVMGLTQAYVMQMDIWPYVIGAVLGYAVFVAIEITFKHLRGIDGLGRGDAKLLGAAGAWVGWAGLPYVVLIGSVMGIVGVLILSRKNADGHAVIAFGPYLCVGLIVVWVAQNITRLGV